MQHLLLVEPNDEVAAILTERVRELAQVHGIGFGMFPPTAGTYQN